MTCHCQGQIDQQLRDLPDRYAALTAALIPGQTASGERVTSRHVHAGLPARVDTLSLLGPGGDVPLTLQPKIRHWSARRKVLVAANADGHAPAVEIEVEDWFHELVVDADGRLVMLPDDEQIGIVPPREWLDQQVRRWRAHFGHHVPARTLVEHHGYLPTGYQALLATRAGPAAIGFLTAVHHATGSLARMAYRGLLTDRHPDPRIDAIERRVGVGESPKTMHWDIRYLRTWLPKAYTEDALDIAAFAAQLNALHAEITRVLGDAPERSRVGRCPAFITDVDGDGAPIGRKRPCGAELWQDTGAYLSAQTTCPRCRTVWDLRGHAGAGTAREIRRVWPVDRRRRYTLDEIDRLRTPSCPGCGRRVKLQWRDVTGSRDRERTWQPAGAVCGNGCDAARRVL